MATVYTIKDFPEELHRAAKVKAAMEGISLKELILKALRQYLEGGK